MDFLIVLNVMCIFASAWVAKWSYDNWGNTWVVWLNVGASALNAAIVLNWLVRL